MRNKINFPINLRVSLSLSIGNYLSIYKTKIRIAAIMKRPASQFCILRSINSQARLYFYHKLFHRNISQCNQAKFPASNMRDSEVKKTTAPRLDSITLHRLQTAHQSYCKRRMIYSGIGVIAGMIGIFLTAMQAPPLPAASEASGSYNTNQLETTNSSDDLFNEKSCTKIIIKPPGESVELTPTGNSTVPVFPNIITLESKSTTSSKPSFTEYQLLGLGIRTVSFLRIQVYIVGIYIARDDTIALQNTLLKYIDTKNMIFSGSAKEELRRLLKNPETSELIWNSILQNDTCRTLVRIVPTRNTDFGHLRDAWVRVLTARAKSIGWQDDGFGQSLGEFKKILAHGGVPKGKELLLSRELRGKLDVWYSDGKSREKLGELRDERISRAIWLGYLAGKTVACDSARESVIAGLLELADNNVNETV